MDLFSGAGGLGAGIEAAGWTVVAAVDHDRAALETHRANFRGQALDVDMSAADQVAQLVELLRPLQIDLVAGGPPCQPFSRAGRSKIRSLVSEGIRDKIDARKELWRSFVDVVLELKPRAVLMENVPDMAISDDLRVIREIADLLESAGYSVDYRLLDAWRYGVPQHRKRFILQARNDGAVPRWPQGSGIRPTVRDAIGDLPSLEGTTGARELTYGGNPSSELAKSLRGDSTATIHDHMTRPVRDDDREAFKLMTSKTLYSELPEHLRRYRSDTFNDKYKRLDWDELSRTITAHIAKDGYWYIHPEEHRTLTVREAARLQTFPDCFRFAGTRSDAFRQIGNAVPPVLGQVVSSAMLPVVDSDVIERPRIPRLRSLLTEWSEEQRRSKWWLYPGPDMTVAGAAVAALLEVHRMPTHAAQEIMAPLRGIPNLSLDLLAHIDVSKVSRTRRETVRKIRHVLRQSMVEDSALPIGDLLTQSQSRIFSLLCGRNELLLSDHVSKVVALLMQLPEGQTGLRTDIKVALAQIVASDETAALRMCAIRTISVSEARARIVL